MSAYREEKVIQHPKTPVVPQPLYFSDEKFRARRAETLDIMIKGFAGNFDFPSVDGKRLTAYTFIEHANGRAVAIDARYDFINAAERAKGTKEHRTIFADQLGLNSVKWSALAAHDLLLPGNVPELAQAIWGEVPVIVIWCEGEKTRRALQHLMEHGHAIAKAEELGVRIVTSCWFNGFAGAKGTNFALMPRAHQPEKVKVAGINDRALPLDKPVRHIFVLDADAASGQEAAEVMRRFREQYRVDPTKLVLVDPPTAVDPGSGWDDADMLPAGWTPELRINEILDAEPGDVAPAFSEDALALLFAQRYAEDMRYIAARSLWVLWQGALWKYDNTLECFNKARTICRQMAPMAGKQSAVQAMASAKTVAAVERLSKADRRIAATLLQWDADPDIFNTKEPS